MTIRLEFFVPGQPVGKGRPRVTIHGTYTPARTREAEKAVRTEAMKALSEVDVCQDFPNTVTGVKIKVFAKYRIPKSWDNKSKYEARHGLLVPGKPDLDNVVKLVMDALNGVLYPDDKAVEEITASKAFDEVPGLHIRIECEE